MSGRSKLTRRFGRIALALCVLGLAMTTAAYGAPAGAASSTVSVAPGTGLLDGQYVLVTWSGFQPGADVFLWECGQNATWTIDCVKPSAMFYNEVGFTDDYPLSDASGGGSLWIPVGAASVPSTASFECSATHPCEIAITQNPPKGHKHPRPERLGPAAPITFAA